MDEQDGLTGWDANTNATDVDAVINYAGPSDIRLRMDIVELERNNAPLEPHTVRIHDVRARARSFSLDANGFEFARHKSAVACDPALFEQGNEQETVPSGRMGRYSAEMIAFLGDKLGASAIVPQVGSFISRASSKSAKKTWAATANMAHLDYTQIGAELFLKWNAEALGGELPPHSYYAFIQTWRAVSKGPQDNALAICDGESVPPEDGVEIDAVLGPAERPGACFPFRLCKFREGHNWFYLADMDPDDVLLFKGFDSRNPLAMNAMHSAFDNPLAGETAEPRRSIEARFIAFFD